MDAVLTQTIAGDTRRSTWAGNLWIAVVLGLAGLVVLPVDVVIVAVFEHKQLPAAIDQPLKEVLEICEAFGHGFGVSLIIVASAVLAPQMRRYLPWVIAGSLGSGLVANLLKLCVSRTRPRDFDLAAGTVWNTFDRGFSGSAAMQSFPSAHTATAVGLAVMLTALFPRGRWFFAMLAVLVGMQRIVSSSHFPSDVLAGAVVGWLVAQSSVASSGLPAENAARSRKICSAAR